LGGIVAQRGLPMPKNIYDNRGRKIGEIRDAGEEAVGIALFLYLIWKALPGLLVLALIYLLIQGAVWVWNAGTNLAKYGVIDEQEIQIRAKATQIAEENSLLLAKAQQAVVSEDYYIAAAILRNIIERQPDNQKAKAMLNKIKDHVPGGLVVNHQYYPFSSMDAITFINGVYNKLINISPDGRRALFTAFSEYIVNYSRDLRVVLLELDSGKFIGLGEDIDKNLRRVARGNNLVDIFNGDSITVECWPPYRYGGLDGLWSNDGRWLANVADGAVEIVDLSTGVCKRIIVPGLNKGLAITDGTQIWIIFKGNSTTLRLLTLDMNGNNTKEVGKLEDIYWPKVILLSPDSSALYVADGFASKIISTRTGLTADAIKGATVWLSNAPLIAHIPSPLLEVNPPKVRMGDPVDIKFWRGEPGITAKIVIQPDPWNYSRTTVSTDAHGKFTVQLKTGINTPIGIYTVAVVKYDNIIAHTTFEIVTR
jgi:hypothetical protein